MLKNARNNKISAWLLTLLLLGVLIGCVVPTVILAADGEPEYVYFDLAAGDITVTGSSYTGYIYKLEDGNYTLVELNDTLKDGEAYYVFQSYYDEETGERDGYFTEDGDGAKTVTIPQRTPIEYDSKSWGDYITNNSDVEAVIKAWNDTAPNAGRESTPNRISVTGLVDCTMVIDNLWSSFHVKDTYRMTGGISFNPSAQTEASCLTLSMVGDNRLGNIYYQTGTKTVHRLYFEEKQAGATLTVANLVSNGDKNYWNSAIGASDNNGENSRGLVFNGGTVFAGTNAKDDCTAIGGGGNGVGVVTINGGRITATVISSGAAIGGGIGKSSAGGAATVTITGGEVYAYNASCKLPKNYTAYPDDVKYIPAAAIGGGSSGKSVCNKCTVTITGGKVFAQSVGGTAIGGGSSADKNGGSADIIIGGSAQVSARSIAGEINGQSVPAGVAIGGGTGGIAGNGGSVSFTVEENAVLQTGSIGGGSTIGDTATYKIGHAEIKITGGTISGQFIMAEGAAKNCTFNMSNGVINNGDRDPLFVFLEQNGGAIFMDDSNGQATLSGGTIRNSSALNGGAIYMTAGKFTLSGTGKIESCAATQNGGAAYLGGGNFNVEGGSIEYNSAALGGGVYLHDGEMLITGGEILKNTAAQNGGGAYLGGGELTAEGGIVNSNTAVNGGGAYLASGTMTVNGGIIRGNEVTENGGGAYLNGSASMLIIESGEMSSNKAANGGGAYVNGGKVVVNNGAILSNRAEANGGGIMVSNGDYEMHGGHVDGNTALTGMGGGIYVSAQGSDVTVNVFSGSVSSNSANLQGGAFAVVGGTENINVTIGVNDPVHFVDGERVECIHGNCGSTTCPVINNNRAITAGGAVYVSGSRNAVLKIFCVQETGSLAGDGEESSRSDFMMMDGGTVYIMSSEDVDENASDSSCGYVSIDSSIHVTGGVIYIDGSMSNPIFNSRITVDIKKEEDKFVDFRSDIVGEDSYYKLRYYENFKGDSDIATGQYTAYQFKHGESHVILDVIYSHTGYVIDGWYLNEEGSGYKYRIGANCIFDGTVVQPDNDTDDIHSGDLTIYAHWIRNGYSVIFLPGVPDEKTYSGEMENQDFAYGKEGTLSPNAYSYPGHLFDYWLDEESGETYENKAPVINLSDVNGAKIYLKAIWMECSHDENSTTQNITFQYKLLEENQIERRCVCDGFSEHITITADNTVYNEEVQKQAHLVFSNEATAWNVSEESIVYTKNEVETDPQNAGAYKASITVADVTATVSFLIDKKTPDAPAIPEFDVSVDEQDGTQKIVVRPDASGKTREYRVYYYSDGELNPLDWQDSDTLSLPINYTNYIVAVRYKEDKNHYHSGESRSKSVFYYSAENSDVKIYTAPDEGFMCFIEEKEGEGLKIVVVAVDGYYKPSKYSVTATTTKDGEPYEGGATVSKDLQWLENIPANGSYEITVSASGAREMVSVKSVATENKVFGNVNSDGTNTVIGCDSAFTVVFEVSHYYAYSGLRLDFGTEIPADSSVILVDKTSGENQYWYYNAIDATSSVDLADFLKMGDGTPFEVVGDSFQYQFVIDFSKSESGFAEDELTVSLDATQDTETEANVPTFIENGALVAVEDVRFALLEESQNGLRNQLSLVLAKSTGVCSKWQGRRTALVLTPVGELPADACVKVEDGIYTTTYYRNADGNFVIALSGSSDSVGITLESDMFPTGAQTYEMDAVLYGSPSLAGRAPMNGEQKTQALRLGFDKALLQRPALKVVSDKHLYDFGEVLTVKVNYDIPDGYSVSVAMFLKKDKNDTYNSTGWSKDDIADGEMKLTLDFQSVAGSYCLVYTVKDDLDVAVMSVPFYFIIN